jgi:glycogen synthase
VSVKVLMTTETAGGSWTYALELARALGRRQVKVDLATMGAPLRPEQAREALAIRNLTLHLSHYRLEWMEEPWDDVDEAGRWLLALARRLRPDVVHLNSLCHGCLPFSAPVVVVVHSCMLSRWWGVEGTQAPPDWEGYRERVARGLRAAEMVVVPSRAALEWTDFLYGPLHPLRVVRPGRSAAGLLPGSKQPYVAAMGGLGDRARNLRALGAVAPRLPWPVRVAGELPVAGQAPDPQQEELQQEGLELLGPLGREALADHLGRASIYAHPALYDPAGVAVLEAALAGCALVLSDLPSLREVWEGAAELVPPGDEQALQEAFGRLIARPDRRRELAAASRLRGLELTPERMAVHYLEVYRQASAPHPRPVDLSSLLPEHALLRAARPPAIA